MALVRTVIIVAVVLIILYLILRWALQPVKQLSHLSPGTHAHDVRAHKLGNESGSSDYTYSMWFYVDDWNYRFGDRKVLLMRGSPQGAHGMRTPFVYMGEKENNLVIDIDCYPTPSDTVHGHSTSKASCGIENFPLQRWVNVIISVYGRSLDVYVDGKLFRTCVLPNVTKVDSNADVFITPGGGFKGYTANFQYWPQSVNPQQAYNIYKTGYGGNWLSNIFNKYRLRIQFLEGNRVSGSFEI